jgi:hypothetical protein
MEEETLIFHKSDKTDRWWIEIPFISNGNNKLKEIRYYLVLTTNIWEHVIRSFERWWKAQRKQYLKDDFNTTILIL